jgi:peptidyl-tRNA hydrolase
MSAGLVGAQVSHIGDAFMREKIVKGKKFTAEEKDWMKTPYISVLAVNNLEELDKVVRDANDSGLPVHVWSDTIPSTVQPNCFLEDVLVGISIGPSDFDSIKAVCGYLNPFNESMPTKTKKWEIQ